MSWLAHRAVKTSSLHKPAAKLVLSYIADSIYDRRGGLAWIRHRELQEWANLTPRYMRSLLPRLVASGELVIYQRTGDSNAYAIPLYPGETGYEPPAPCTATDHICNGNHAPAPVDREALHDTETDRRKAALASNGATPHGNVPADTRPTRTKQHLPPTAPDAATVATVATVGPAADTWAGPPDADDTPFDLSGRTDAERAADLAAERYAGVPPAKRRRNPGTRGGLGGWPT